MRPHRPRTSTGVSARGVSDLVGYAVVFGIVAISISLLYTVGTAALADLQHDQAMDNAERAFDIVAANVADIHRNDAPGRTVELQFAGGQLAHGERTGVTVTNATDREIDGGPIDISVEARPLTYSSRSTEIAYVGGAVIRSDRGYAVMGTEPPFRFDEDRIVLSLLEVIAADPGRSVGGTGTSHIAARHEGSTIERTVADPGPITVTVTSPRAEAWHQYFDGQRTNCRDTGTVTRVDETTVTFTCEADSLYVRRTTITLRLSS